MRRNKKRAKKSGLSPGTLVYTGEKDASVIEIEVFSYDSDQYEEIRLKDSAKLQEHIKESSRIWVNVFGISEISIIEEIGKIFNLHPLLLEDVVNATQRSKLEIFDDYLFIVLRVPVYSDGKIRSDQISLVLGKNYVLSFQESNIQLFSMLKERLAQSKNHLVRQNNSGYLCYRLIDTVMDKYFEILEKFGEELDELEEALIVDPEIKTLHKIYALKGEIIFLRKMSRSLRELSRNLQQENPPLMGESIRVYLRDINDHSIRILDTIETYRETISGMIDIYMSIVNTKMNETMKMLTLIATIFIPLSFIAGVYGMNFKHMPELEWRWGYPMVWSILILVAISMLSYFRKRRWI